MHNKFLLVIFFFLLFSFVFSACGTTIDATDQPSRSTRTPTSTKKATSSSSSKPTQTPISTPEPVSKLGATSEDLDGTEIEIWHSWSGLAGDEFDRLIKDFSETNEWNINVESRYQGDYDQTYENLSFSLKDGPRPDVVIGYNYQALGLDASEEVFVDLEAYSVAGIPHQEAAFVNADSKDEWTVIPFPSPDGEPAIDVYGSSFQVLKTDETEQLASWLIIKWLTSPENQAVLSQATGFFPVRQSSLEHLDILPRTYPQWAEAVDLLSMAGLSHHMLHGVLSTGRFIACILVSHGLKPKLALFAQQFVSILLILLSLFIQLRKSNKYYLFIQNGKKSIMSLTLGMHPSCGHFCALFYSADLRVVTSKITAAASTTARTMYW
jgi:ABC-type glycerol-3-phosphate transport system substrate-binding protein